jgi:lactoylglutathione lyase
MKTLGAFSISLTVKNISESRQFYEKLGFIKFGGDETQNWLIMKNGDAIIGLFHGMFPTNIITFNPGWNQDAQEVNPFTDIREIQQELLGKGITPDQMPDPSSTGPAHLMLTDPDGNKILIDQHR